MIPFEARRLAVRLRWNTRTLLRRYAVRVWHQVMATDEEAERYSRVDDELRRMGL